MVMLPIAAQTEMKLLLEHIEKKQHNITGFTKQVEAQKL